MSEKHLFRITYQDKRPSFARFLFMWGATCAVPAIVLFAPGVIVNSPAMQWAGFIVVLFCMCCFLGALIWLLSSDWMTIEEAKQKLVEIEQKQQNSRDKRRMS